MIIRILDEKMVKGIAHSNELTNTLRFSVRPQARVTAAADGIVRDGDETNEWG